MTWRSRGRKSRRMRKGRDVRAGADIASVYGRVAGALARGSAALGGCRDAE